MKIIPDIEADSYLFIESRSFVVGVAFLDAGWIRFKSAQKELVPLEARQYRSVAAIRRAIFWLRGEAKLRNATSRWPMIAKDRRKPQPGVRAHRNRISWR
jgi:hypothetical protein